MADTFETKLQIASWDERPYRELADGSRFTRADVVVGGGTDATATDAAATDVTATGAATTDAITEGSFEALLYYRPDGTSSYVTLMRLTGNLGGKSGTFVLRGEGTYDGSTARMAASVIDGSQTGDLAGLSATVESVSTSADYPFMPLTVSYTLE
ncbi:MAG TPA: DUF3224 domain-containing protein [Streptosporangiaceae bacterium]|nr:DUF3224 domain-containing protein [Streptosporangiaceae bacterium]